MRSFFSTHKKRVFTNGRYFPFTKIMNSFNDTVISLQYTRKDFFHDSRHFLQKKQKIRLINPKISKRQLHTCTSDYGGECRTPSKLDIHYGLILLCGSNIVNPSIKSKPRLRARFG